MAKQNKGQFKAGNKAAQKWTPETMLPEVKKVYDVLTRSEDGLPVQNPVRANDIKYAEEAVMCTDVPLTAWDYWNSSKFTHDENSAVFLLLKKIKRICELRLSYSGETMDIFHLKNHYNYTDKKEVKTEVDIKGYDIIIPGEEETED